MKFDDYKEYLSPALAKATDLIVEKGQGCYITTVDGERYLDFVQGIAVNALGHCYPPVVEAIKEQCGKLIDGSFNVMNFPTTLMLAKKLAAVTPGRLNSVFFSNGGAESTDGAIKLARAYTGRTGIIAFKGSFHGRTMGAVSVTGSNSKYRKYCEPLMGGVYFTPYPSRDLCPDRYNEEQRGAFCLKELENTLKYLAAPETVAAVLMEPIQGEGGYVVPAKSFVKGVHDICTKYGILLIFDEIQSGYGRTGKMFAGENFDIIPDIMTIGKAIAGGLPMSAVVSTPEIMEEWHAGMHGTTFGGNPVCAAAGCEVLRQFEALHILEHVREAGAYLQNRLMELKEKYPIIYDVRGLGLMLACEFSYADGTPAGDICRAVQRICLENHMLTLSCGVEGNGIRFAAPLNVTIDTLDEGLRIFEKAVAAVQPVL